MPNFFDDNLPLPPPKVDRFVQNDPEHQWGATDVQFVYDTLSDARAVLKRNTVDVRAFGAAGDGVTPDDAAINAAIAAIAPARVGIFGGGITLGPGTYLCSAPIVIPNGVALLGETTAAVAIKASSTFNSPFLVGNALQNGTQEFAFISGLTLDGNQGAGAVCSEAVLSLGGLFVNSAFRDLLVKNGSNDGLHVTAGGSPGGAGPLRFDNIWAVNNVGHNVNIEELAGNAGAMMGMLFVGLYSEHQGSNKSAVYLKGRGNASNVTIVNLHVEQGLLDPATGLAATGRTCLTFDGISDCQVVNFQVLGTPSTVSEVVKLTNVAQNVGLEITRLTNPNLIGNTALIPASAVLRDLKNGVTITSPNYNLRRWTTPDQTFGGPRFTPVTGSVGAAFQDTGGTDRLWTNTSGQVTGASLNGAALDVVADVTNNRVQTWQRNAGTGGGVFEWVFPDASNVRFRNRSGGVDLMNFDNSGNGFVYNQLTFQKALSLPNEVLLSVGATPGDLAPAGIQDAFMLILTPTVASAPTGITAPAVAKPMMVYNDSTVSTVTFANNAGGTAANGVIGKAGIGMVLAPKTGAWLYYSPSKARWLEVSL